MWTNSRWKGILFCFFFAFVSFALRSFVIRRLLPLSSSPLLLSLFTLTALLHPQSLTSQLLLQQKQVLSAMHWLKEQTAAHNNLHLMSISTLPPVVVVVREAVVTPSRQLYSYSAAAAAAQANKGSARRSVMAALQQQKQQQHLGCAVKPLLVLGMRQA